MDENKLTFPQFIRIECGKRDISIKRMCELIGIDPKIFTSSYRNSYTRARWLLKIADFFEVDVRDLIMMDLK